MSNKVTTIIYLALGLLLVGAATIALLALNRLTQADIAPQAIVTQVNPPRVDELLTLVNAERQKVGVAPLILDERLNKSAQQKADDMNVNNYFDHVDKNGRHGYDIAHEYAPDICMNPGENITDNQIVSENTSVQSISNFVHSPKHYAAMISAKNVYTGFGISGTKVVEHFCYN